MALLLLAGLAAAQERRVFGRIRTRLPDDIELRLLDGDKVVRKERLPRDGRFDFSGLKPGLYRLRAITRRHDWFEREVNLYFPRREVTAKLEPAVVLRGRVELRGVPKGKTVVELIPGTLPSLVPTLWLGPGRMTTCAEDGTFTLRNCTAGERVLLVHHNYGMVGEDETDIDRQLVVELKGTETRTTIVVEPDEDVRLAVKLPAGTDEVEGELAVNSPFNVVEPFLFHVHRGKQGESRIFRGNRGGFYDYSARRKAASVRVPGLWRREFGFFLVTRGCKEIRRFTRIDGPTVMRFELEAVRGRTVTLEKEPNGSFEVHHTGITQDRPVGFLPEGEHHVTFESDRYLAHKKNVRVTHGSEPLVLSFPHVPGPKVVGRLANAEGAPITILPPGGMRLAMYPRPLRYATVRDGRFEVAALPPGRYEVRIRDLVLTTFQMGTESIVLDLQLPE